MEDAIKDPGPHHIPDDIFSQLEYQDLVDIDDQKFLLQPNINPKLQR